MIAVYALQVFRAELRHGRLVLTEWSGCVETLQQCCLASSCDPDGEIESFMTRDTELTNRWTCLLQAVSNREVSHSPSDDYSLVYTHIHTPV